MWLKKASNYFLDLIFPVYCQGCGGEGAYLCVTCQGLILEPNQRCIVCNKNSLLGRTHPDCSSQSALAGLLVTAEYDHEPVRNLVWHLKYSSVSGISQTLAVVMADFFVSQDIIEYFSDAIVTAVPLHKKRSRERGYNQANLLAREFARRLGLAYFPLLKRTANTKRQVDLERNQRLENVREIFEIAPGLDPQQIANRKIVLVDDVATTGATLNECAEVLKQCNSAEIWGLVVARN